MNEMYWTEALYRPTSPVLFGPRRDKDFPSPILLHVSYMQKANPQPSGQQLVNHHGR